MPVFPNKKALYIHVPKCGGTSITYWISNILHDMSNDKEHMHGITSSNVVLHSLPLSLYDKYCSVDFSLYFKFCVVRNPYDRIVSDYFWNNRGLSTFKEFVKLVQRTLLEHPNYSDDFYIIYNHPLYPNHFLPQNKVIESDKYKMDHICKFETLASDINIVKDKLNIESNLPLLNKTNHKNFLEYYDSETKNIVRDLYKDDFELFNYDM